MFTGLVETVGMVKAVTPRGPIKRYTVSAPFAAELELGESVAIDGTCQTVVNQDDKSFAVEAVPETLKRTTFGEFRVGREVNLERALRFSDRLGGHLVSGHIDCTGRVAKVLTRGEERILTVDYPADYASLMVDKGSVAIDGVSLTVVEASLRQFTVAIIPHTWDATTLRRLRPGERVNLEFDLVAKYILRSQQVGEESAPGLWSGTPGKGSDS